MKEMFQSLCHRNGFFSAPLNERKNFIFSVTAIQRGIGHKCPYVQAGTESIDWNVSGLVY
jgi:hypothetical protein